MSTQTSCYTVCLLRMNLQKKLAAAITTIAPMTIATMMPAANCCAGEEHVYVVVRPNGYVLKVQPAWPPCK